MITNDGSVQAHRSVLAHVCPELLFKSKYVHCKVDSCPSDERNLEGHPHFGIFVGMSIKALKLFLLLLYTTNEVDGFVVPELSDAIDEHFEELYDAVTWKYKVERGLGFVFLEPALVKNLTPDNCWYFYKESLFAASLYHKMRSSEICYNYILGYYTKAIKSSSFLEEMKRDRKRLHRLMVCMRSLKLLVKKLVNSSKPSKLKRKQIRLCVTIN